MPAKKTAEPKEEQGIRFTFRVKMGEYEVELGGTYEEVSKALEKIPVTVNSVHAAFEEIKPKTVVTITAKTEESPETPAKTAKEIHPKIGQVKDVREAVVAILETEWGKWRPRTVDEVKEVMKANQLRYPNRVVSDTLEQLAEKGIVKRWNTNTGSVYILAEGKIPGSGGGSK